MRVSYDEEHDALSIAFQPETVAEHTAEETRYVEPLDGVRLWYSEAGTLFALEVESRASARVDISELHG